MQPLRPLHECRQLLSEVGINLSPARIDGCYLTRRQALLPSAPRPTWIVDRWSDWQPAVEFFALWHNLPVWDSREVGTVPA